MCWTSSGGNIGGETAKFLTRVQERSKVGDFIFDFCEKYSHEFDGNVGPREMIVANFVRERSERKQN
jgi:hypothetical protein